MIEFGGETLRIDQETVPKFTMPAAEKNRPLPGLGGFQIAVGFDEEAGMNAQDLSQKLREASGCFDVEIACLRGDSDGCQILENGTTTWPRGEME